MKLRHGSLFSGIGGFDLAARWMGWQNVFHCEKDPFAQKVLKYHFPESISYHDIKETDFSVHANAIDIISGGFPCQPYSLAGKRKGKEDDRHLWPEMLRAIRDVKPRWVVGENVLGLVNWSGGLVFEEVQSDLEAQGYQVQTFILPACSVDAPHRRDRCWIVAYSDEYRKQQRESEITRVRDIIKTSSIGADTYSGLLRSEESKQKTVGGKQLPKSGTTPNTSSSGGVQQRESIRDKDRNNKSKESGRQQFQDGFGGSLEREVIFDTENIGRKLSGDTRERGTGFANSDSTGDYWENWPTESPLCGNDDGVPSRLVGTTFSKHRNDSIKGYGNAVVPQLPYKIFKAIEEYELMVNQSQQ